MKNETTLTVTVEIDGIEYIGDFTFHRLKVIDYAEIESIKSMLLKGMPSVDAALSNVTNMVSELKVATKASPEWWDIDNLYDVQALKTVYDKYVNWADTFFRKSGKEVKTPKETIA